METKDRPLTTLVGQGWELAGYAQGHDPKEGLVTSFLLRRQKQHKILKVRPKWFGRGVVATELDI